MVRVRALAVGFSLVLCGSLAAAPAMAAAGSIAGTVTAVDGGAAIGGIWVCASTRPFGPIGGCEITDSAGKYEIDSLQPSFYEVSIEAEGRQNYLPQWYPGKPIREEAEWVEVKSGEDRAGIDAVLEVGGQITGTVTDVEGGAPIEGIEVCAHQIDRVTEFGVIRCQESNADGEYTVWALPTGQFKVEFEPPPFSRDAPNYIRQYYPGKSSWSEAEVRGVTAGTTSPGIDAVMQRGIGVSGTVSEADGGPVYNGNTRACALDADSEAIVDCTGLEMDGTYWLPGLPFGDYRISFAVDVEEDGQILHPDGFVRQYYNGKPTFAEADVLASAGPTVFSGIDAQLVRGPEVIPVKLGLPRMPPPVIVTPAERPVSPSLHCRKGFRKKWVEGKRRCVRVHNKRHRHPHRGGPHTAASGR
jgi:hypothetical protein